MGNACCVPSNIVDDERTEAEAQCRLAASMIIKDAEKRLRCNRRDSFSSDHVKVGDEMNDSKFPGLQWTLKD